MTAKDKTFESNSLLLIEKEERKEITENNNSNININIVIVK